MKIPRFFVVNKAYIFITVYLHAQKKYDITERPASGVICRYVWRFSQLIYVKNCTKLAIVLECNLECYYDICPVGGLK